MVALVACFLLDSGTAAAPPAEKPLPLFLLRDLPVAFESGASFLERTPWDKGSGNMERVFVEQRSLVLTCEGDRVIVAYQEAPFPFALSQRPFLQFALKVEDVPLRADLSATGTDDACFRLFLIFGKQSIFSTPPMLAYVWASKEEPETIVASGHSDKIKYLVIGKGKPAEDRYYRFVRDAAADYRKAFAGADPPAPLHGVALKLDTNQLGGKGKSRLSFLCLSPSTEWRGPADVLPPPEPRPSGAARRS